MPKSQFLVCHVAYGFNLVVSENEEAVGTEQIIAQQEGVVCGYKHLIASLKQSLANLIGQFMVVESIKLVNEHE